jgi:hypothetical protein
MSQWHHVAAVENWLFLSARRPWLALTRMTRLAGAAIPAAGAPLWRLGLARWIHAYRPA